ncbi:uncharacterized protein [Drosophila kikkawai]|uniref:C2H2-type domain-containing protein n=1 Tax=Drosophila kikkawai TaxID=30033 RepID=A0A6P4J1Y1_DROKI|nr:zinc finger protein 777 [Drosophila kikkawai]
MNVDMSEIIEFDMRVKGEYSDDDEDSRGGVGSAGGVGGGANGVVDVVGDDATYVVLEGLTNDYDEEFLIVNEDATGEGELLLGDCQLQQHVDNGMLIASRVKSLPVDDQGNHFVITELRLSEMGELVEEEEEEQKQKLVANDYAYIYPPKHEQCDDLDIKPGMSPPSLPSSPSPQSPLPPPPPALAPPTIKLKSSNPATPQFVVRSYGNQNAGGDDGEIADVKPTDKMLEEFKGPRRYMLFDDLIATIVDFDEDNTPIVEFSMISSQTDEKLPVECGICPDVMHKSKLSRHQKTHLVPGTNRYACVYCSETYRDCKYLAGHARRHMGIRPYVCEVCTLYFSTKQDLRVHNQRRHLEKEHICEMCGKTFAQNTQLKRHREATHEKKRRFQCQYCQKAYYKNFSLQEHIRNVHMGKRRMLKCPFCGMQCRDAHKMARHRKDMHLSQGLYECHLCQEEFTDINYFDAHKRSIQCRSNTRRYVGSNDQADGNGSASGSISGGMLDGGDDDDEGMGILEEEYDEDAGLLVEEGDAETTVVVNGGHYLNVADEQQQQHHQYVQIADYNGQGLLVEEEEVEEEEENVENDNVDPNAADVGEEYFNTVSEQYQQQQQIINMVDEFNDELIYEITLKTEDN